MNAEREDLFRQAQFRAAARERQIQAIHDETRSREMDRLSKIVVPSIDQLRSVGHREFELLIGGLFERLGYRVQITPASNDKGRDGIIWKDGKKLLFECKKYAQEFSVGRPAVQKFHSAIITDRASGGFYLTTSYFTKSAQKLVDSIADCDITLLDAFGLIELWHEGGRSGTKEMSYDTICRACGEMVQHDLYEPTDRPCQCGALVAPSLDVMEVLAATSKEFSIRESRDKSRRWVERGTSRSRPRSDIIGDIRGR